MMTHVNIFMFNFGETHASVHIQRTNVLWNCSLFFFLGIVKTYNIAFIECETLQAVFSKDLTPNKLVAPTRWGGPDNIFLSWYFVG